MGEDAEGKEAPLKYILMFNQVRNPYAGYEAVVFPDHMVHAEVHELYMKSAASEYVKLTAAGHIGGDHKTVTIGSDSLGIEKCDDPERIEFVRGWLLAALDGE